MHIHRKTKIIIAIVNATIKDITELTILVNHAYRGAESKHGWTNEAEILDGPRIDHKILVEQFNTKNAVILKYDDDRNKRIIGAVYLEVQENKLYFGTLTVPPQIQRKGTGTSLLDFAVAYGRQHNCKVLYGTILNKRPELMEWYSHHGFKYTGKISPFPKDPRVGTPKVPLKLMEIEKDIT